MCGECGAPLALPPSSQALVTHHKCVRCGRSITIKHWCDMDDRSLARSLFTHGKWFGPYCGNACLSKDWLVRARWNLEHPDGVHSTPTD